MKWVRGNTKPPQNKNICSAIRLTKTRSHDSIISYKKQRYLVVKFNKSKFEYFIKYDLNKQAKPFWKNCKPYFSTKPCKADTNIMLNENWELVMKNQDNANTFND